MSQNQTATKNELAHRIQEFLEYCEVEKQHSPLTITNYARYLGRFCAWASEHGVSKPGQVTIDTVRQYRLWLNRQTDQTGQPLKRTTQNYYVIALRAFAKYLEKRDIETVPAAKIELGKAEKRTVEFLNADEVKRLREAARSWSCSIPPACASLS
jgi:site-specific recombinase XerD